MEKIYHIELDGQKIGTTRFEDADPPMGVVFGKIEFKSITSGYEFFREHCLKNNVPINEDEPKFKFIDTQVIPGLKIYTEERKELKGVAGNHISGFDEDGLEITVLGIPYPFYEDEFPNHVKNYREQFE